VPYLSESFARNARWAIRAEPQLSMRPKDGAAKATSAMVCHRLTRGFPPNANAFRFSIFQFQFLRAIENAGVSYSEQLKRYNQSLGKPPAQWVQQLQKWAQETALCDTYEAMYPCMGCVPMKPRSIYAGLLNAVLRSETNGYHEENVYVPRHLQQELWKCACGKTPCMYDGRLDVARTHEELLGLARPISAGLDVKQKEKAVAAPWLQFQLRLPQL